MNSLPIIGAWFGYFLEPKPQREARVCLVIAQNENTQTVCLFRGRKGRVFSSFGRN